MRRRIDARCAERQRSRRWRATAGWLPAAGHPAAARQANLPRIASDRSRQIAAEEIRLPFAVRVAGDRGHAVKLPLIRFFAGIRGKHLHMRSGDGHVTELVDDAIEPVEIPMVFDGLERSQLKMARATVLTPAWPIRRMSSSQISSGHWSGL